MTGQRSHMATWWRRLIVPQTLTTCWPLPPPFPAARFWAWEPRKNSGVSHGCDEKLNDVQFAFLAQMKLCRQSGGSPVSHVASQVIMPPPRSSPSSYRRSPGVRAHLDFCMSPRTHIFTCKIGLTLKSRYAFASEGDVMGAIEEVADSTLGPPLMAPLHIKKPITWYHLVNF